MKSAFLKSFVLMSMILAGVEMAAQRSVMVHSHNDYRQSRPFWNAYTHHAASIEADVYLVDGVFLEMDANEAEHAEWLDNMTMELPFYGIGEFMRQHAWGSIVLDLRASVDLGHFTVSFVVNNLLNAEYSLRPLYIEAPRTYTLQMVYRFRDINPVTWFKRSKADVARL